MHVKGFQDRQVKAKEYFIDKNGGLDLYLFTLLEYLSCTI